MVRFARGPAGPRAEPCEMLAPLERSLDALSPITERDAGKRKGEALHATPCGTLAGAKHTELEPNRTAPELNPREAGEFLPARQREESRSRHARACSRCFASIGKNPPHGTSPINSDL